MAIPLAERMRPVSLETFMGQGHLLAEGRPLRQAIESGNLHSMLFWGPPGTGKTTLARLIARHSKADFLAISAVLSGVKEIRAAIEQAKQSQQLGVSTLLFVDEVHRFNKSQQDAFLPHVEDGTFTFVGATTENPSFELNNALLSRARLYRLKPLETEALQRIIGQALQHETVDVKLDLPSAGIEQIIAAADGDARRALNILEIVIGLAEEQKEGTGTVSEAQIAQVVAEGGRRFDKGGDLFYEQISALHKSVRGSNPDAALYWFARMVDGGVDPLYVARRVVRMASEDIGNADPRALQIALNGWESYERLGSPEGELAIAQAISYLAVAPKSNAIYQAWNRVMADVKGGGSSEVPVHLRNAPTKVMKELGYGRAYRYAHDEADGYAAGETYFPDETGERRYYHPVERGMEIKIKQRLEYLQQLDREARK
ncbi:MAG: replication-associated recombination protein A [Gammaproteobacteria bacterium]|jgi:putative ATPase|nr:replication-associated recombination protein A [Gammaproteobacteria bacterium]MBT3488615.1 replication-associated recombination protein A [Gammaproteobacteria bacterium]MBT3717731.1 replication-associated recombination protein A [Gammaproteobacteria bacterium]MBT3844105.1 replication-associated recombination protein A [Gammaproteobacteria bacterium]MBT3893837.1 replication-associated recombination protein A [Gammaproteobacteria bacterium]